MIVIGWVNHDRYVCEVARSSYLFPSTDGFEQSHGKCDHVGIALQAMLTPNNLLMAFPIVRKLLNTEVSSTAITPLELQDAIDGHAGGKYNQENFHAHNYHFECAHNLSSGGYCLSIIQHPIYFSVKGFINLVKISSSTISGK